ncbi:ABC-2 type transport system permease protein [Singulisphaera sp. GP187]|uniref:DUF3526 domain-containing protein n=1 Tax=Singulisphaera sp. GP187 TaxID=1882752 RepID=UPI00092669B1|nr:DUF3526 domain-containing protein [Singulisphaera sp. GP187]SIO23125.1 ABC-2 type transport system permease protein [Singulisphaera sp. GP187]
MHSTLPHFFHLVKWEWRLAAAERSFGLTLAILAVLTGLAFGVGLSWSGERRAVIDQFRAKEIENHKFLRSAFTDQTDLEQIAGRSLNDHEKSHAKTVRVIAKLPTSLAYFGALWNALLPPAPLAPLSIGHSDLWPDRLKITARSKRTNFEREDIINPFQLATGPFDLASLAVALFPLVLLVLNHDLISTDRERGVLALTLSQPTPYLQVVLARLLVRVGVPVSLVVGVSALGLLAGGTNLLNPATAARFTVWAALVLVYGALWGGLALTLNTLGGSSIAHAIALMACWIGMVIVVPAAISKGAAFASPPPPRAELITFEREVNAEAEKKGRELLDQYYRDHPELERPNKQADPYGQMRWNVIGFEVDRQMRPVLQRHRDRITDQVRFAGLWQSLSPALAVKAAMDDLAGTSLTHHLEFTALAEQYHTEFMDYLRPKMMTRDDLILDDYDRLPSYSGLDLGQRLHPTQLGRSFLILGSWTATLYVVGLVRLRSPITTS